MHPRTTWLLAILCVGLTAYALVFESGSPSWSKAGRVFPDLEAAAIQKIAITTPATEAGGGAVVPERTIRFEREGSPPAWWIVEPIRFEAFYAKVESMAYELADAARIADASGSSAAFPPDTPITVRLEARGGRKEMIEIGADHPDPAFPFTYCRAGGDVFVTRKEFRKLFVATLDDLRSRALVPVPLAELAGLEVEGPESPRKRFEREPGGGSWRLREPLDALADRERLDDIAGELNAWTIAEYEDDAADEPSELAKYGLLEPRVKLAVRHRAGRTVSLEIGAPAGEELVHIRHAGQPYVFKASSKPFAPLLEPTENQRSRFVFDLGLEKIEEIRIESPARGAVLREVETRSAKDAPPERAWTVTVTESKASFPGDRDRIDTLVAGLEKLLVLKFLDALPEQAAMEKPVLGIELATGSGRKYALRLGGRSLEPEDRGLPIHHAAVTGEPGGYLVRSELPDVFAASGGHAFRKRDLSELDASLIAHVDIIDGGVEWSLLRLPGEDWTLSEDTPPTGGELDTSKVNTLVSWLHRDRLRAIRFLPDLQDYASRGLELVPPRKGIVVGALVQGDWPPGHFRKLVFGNADEGSKEEALARIDSPGVPPFTVSSELRAAFDAAVEHLHAVTGK